VTRRTGRLDQPPFVDAYGRLHELGWAHSVEVVDPADGRLVGGLYGVRIDGFFAGESMFHRAPTPRRWRWCTSSTGCATPAATLLDVQWTTPHLVSLGAIDVPRHDYLELAGARGHHRGTHRGAARGVTQVPVGRHPPAPRSMPTVVPDAGRRFPPRCFVCPGAGRTH
jgi:leucyl/phenylalanyl-tRNA--protein transferase